MNLLDELRRRTIWQVLIVYVGASWVLLQAIDVFADNLELPGWLFPTAGVLLLIGLPIILATAFIQRRLAASGEVADEAHEKLFTWRNALLGGAAAFLLLFGFAGLYLVIQDRGEAFRPDDALADEVVPGVAVLPFSVSGPDGEIWREGIPSVVTTNLEGIAGLRPIHQLTVLARWNEQARDSREIDESRMIDVARATGARYAVTGSAVGTTENVRLTGAVIDLTDGEILGRPTEEGAIDAIFDLVDRFSVEVVRAIGLATEDELGAIDLRQVTTSSPTALRHYLDGNKYFRRGERERGQIAFDSAVVADSTFALALYMLARAVDGTDTIQGRIIESVPLLLSARRLTNSPRLNLRIRGLLAEQWADGYWVPGFDEDSLVATIADLEAAVRRDPSDAISFNQLGEAYWHSAHIHPLPNIEEKTYAAFERHAELLSEFNLYGHNGHLYEAYFKSHDTLAVRRLLAADAGNAPGSLRVLRRRLIARAAFDDLSEAELAAVLDSLAVVEGGKLELWWYLATPDYWPILKQSGMQDGGCFVPLDAGDLGWFEDNVPGISNRVRAVRCAVLPRLQGLPVRSPGLDSLLLANPTHYKTMFLYIDRGEYDIVQSYLAAQGDSATAARAEADSAGAASHEARVTELEAYLDWKRDGQAERAVERMQSIVQHRNPRLYARMLTAAGRTEEAVQLLRALADLWNWTAALYRLAPLYEELGEPAKARAAYAEFVDRWKDADPRLQPMVDTARAALARLGPIDQ